MHLQRKFVFCLFVILLGGVPIFAQNMKAGDIKNKYQNIEVTRFEIKEGIKFPAESLDVIMTQIVEELENLKRFKQVSSIGETIASAPGPTIRLSGTITKYKAGSRAKRYFIGFGAGMTKVVAHIKFVDTATGTVLFEKDVDGKVWIGLFGGASSGATRGLAKEVAKVTKKQLF